MKVGIAKSIQPTFRLFGGNYRELMKALRYFEESPKAASIWHDDEKSYNAIEEIERLFHNFAASAMTLVDHTRNQIHLLDSSERLYSTDLRAYLGDQAYTQITTDNPKIFLFGDKKWDTGMYRE